jgi:hypothetical protein
MVRRNSGRRIVTGFSISIGRLRATVAIKPPRRRCQRAVIQNVAIGILRLKGGGFGKLRGCGAGCDRRKDDSDCETLEYGHVSSLLLVCSHRVRVAAVDETPRKAALFLSNDIVRADKTPNTHHSSASCRPKMALTIVSSVVRQGRD